MQYVVEVRHESGVGDRYTYSDAETAERVFHFFNTQDGFMAVVRIKD